MYKNTKIIHDYFSFSLSNNFFTDEEKIQSDRDVILQMDVRNIIEHKQRGRKEEFGHLYVKTKKRSGRVKMKEIVRNTIIYF